MACPFWASGPPPPPELPTQEAGGASWRVWPDLALLPDPFLSALLDAGCQPREGTRGKGWGGCIFNSEPGEFHRVSVLPVTKSLWWCLGVRPVMWLSEPQFLHLYSGVLTATLPGLGAWSLALSTGGLFLGGRMCSAPGQGQGRSGGHSCRLILGPDRGLQGHSSRSSPRTSCFRRLLSFCLSFTTQPIFNFRHWGRGGRALWQRFLRLLPFVFSSWVLPALPPSPIPPVPRLSFPAVLILSLPPALPPGSPISLSRRLLPGPPQLHPCPGWCPLGDSRSCNANLATIACDR